MKKFTILLHRTEVKPFTVIAEDETQATQLVLKHAIGKSFPDTFVEYKVDKIIENNDNVIADLIQGIDL